MTIDYQPLATIEPAAARVSLARPGVLLSLVADLIDLAVDAVTALGLLGADIVRATVGPATTLGGDADQPIVARPPVRGEPERQDLPSTVRRVATVPTGSGDDGHRSAPAPIGRRAPTSAEVDA